MKRMLVIALLLGGSSLVWPTSGGAAETRRTATGDNGRRAVLVLDNSPLVVMHTTHLVLQIEKSEVAARSGFCNLTMPAMPMPTNAPRLTAQGTNLNGQAIFTMAGDWQATCTVDFGDGSRATFVFDLGRVLLK